MAKITIVDDEHDFTDGLKIFLEAQGHSVSAADSVAAAREVLAYETPDLLLLDLMLPDGSGLQLLDAFASRKPKKIVIVTGDPGIKSMIGSMVGDGVSYLKKPIEPSTLLELAASLDVTQPVADDIQPNCGLLVGDSEAMQRVYKQIRQVAGTDSTVFIQGESGTGKELVAQAVHDLSGRSGQFVPVNCGALTADLIASQLFGHEQGSFTGANKRHSGFFQRAADGTLFLDEITEMPIDMQTHLLRALETGRILPVGSEREISTNARLLAATNRDPKEAVADGVLREDLYFRLGVFPITLPPLRERGDDVVLLGNLFLERLNRKNATSKGIPSEHLTALKTHHWPGNVRELKHTIDRAYIMAEADEVAVGDWIDRDTQAAATAEMGVGKSIADVEKELIMATLDQVGGDRKAAAASLGISQKTLYNRLKEYESAAEK